MARDLIQSVGGAVGYGRMHVADRLVPMLESANRVLRLLEAFRPGEKDLSLTQIAERLSLPKSSTHRLLDTLIEHEFIEREPASRRYRLGLRVFEIGSIAIHERGLHGAAHPIVERLAISTSETCHLAVLSGTEAVYVYKIDGSSSIIMSSRVGGRAPCYCTSIGKVLIAWSGDEIFRRVVRSGFHAYTPSTITKVARLSSELEKVRRKGYALDLEEFERGLRCIAAPVRDQMGNVVAALGLAGPASRLNSERLRALGEPVMAAAVGVSRNLGFVRQQLAVAVAGT
jgi:DNA-binding IclR family transcriptional regulator